MKSFDEFVDSLTSEQKEALQNALSLQQDESIQQKTKLKSKQSDFEVGADFKVVRNNKTGRTPVKFQHNTWTDDGEGRDITTPKKDLTPRTREKAKKVEVECAVCGQTFWENPQYVYGEYIRCSRCGRK
jgi:DNA-directed RNA polymerase subunit RPC12/RpoP